MIRMNIRGAGHIEFILSVILFLGVVGFALFFFAPSGGDRTIETSLIYSFNEIIGETEVEVDSYSVKINNIPADIDVLEVALSNTLGKKSGVNDDEGNPLESEVAGTGVRFIHGDVPFVTIRVSGGITEVGTIAGLEISSDPSLYEISSSSSSRVVSEARIDELKTGREDEYTELKERFNLAGIDFTFSLKFTSDDEPIEPEITIPEGVEIFSQSRRIEVLRKDGMLEFADLVIRIW